MSPIRLLILGVLCYILFRLIFGPKKAQVKSGPAPDKIQDVLVEDPVCHTYVPQSQAISLSFEDRTVHFCSEKCRDSFINEQKR